MAKEGHFSRGQSLGGVRKQDSLLRAVSEDGEEQRRSWNAGKVQIQELVYQTSQSCTTPGVCLSIEEP